MPKVAWSHSALKEYENCPRRYHATRVAKLYPFEKTEKMLYGDQVHKACEAYAKDRTPPPTGMEFIPPILDSLLRRSGDCLPEYKMAVDSETNPCDWWSKDTWARGIADLAIVDTGTRTAWIVDYKTGNDKYADRSQLEVMSLLAFSCFPEIDTVRSALIFLLKNSVVKARMERSEAEAAWWKYRERVALIENSLDTNIWNPKQSGLCRYCPVKSCEFHPEH